MTKSEVQRMHILMDEKTISNPPLSAIEKHELDRLQEKYEYHRQARDAGPWKPFT